MGFDEEKFERDMGKTQEMLAIREAFLKMEGIFDCVDIFNYINKQELTEGIPIDNIADALDKFHEKGELEIVKEEPPRKYKRTVQPTG